MMMPHRYTELFFLDEATALAAGHRPCFECRRADAERFAALLGAARNGRPLRAPEIDAILRTIPREPDDFRNADRFFAYIGDPALPVLPGDNASALAQRMTVLYAQVEQLMELVLAEFRRQRDHDFTALLEPTAERLCRSRLGGRPHLHFALVNTAIIDQAIPSLAHDKNLAGEFFQLVGTAF